MKLQCNAHYALPHCSVRRYLNPSFKSKINVKIYIATHLKLVREGNEALGSRPGLLIFIPFKFPIMHISNNNINKYLSGKVFIPELWIQCTFWFSVSVFYYAIVSQPYSGYLCVRSSIITRSLPFGIFIFCPSDWEILLKQPFNWSFKNALFEPFCK